MTRVGWLFDRASHVGGAELTEQEFRAAAPEGVEIVDCPKGDVDRRCDCYVVHNCVTYSMADFRSLPGRIFKYHNDVGSWMPQDVWGWLGAHARHICISPIQADYMRFKDPLLIPPPVNLQRFYAAADRVNGSRAGTVSVGSWRNRGKGAPNVMRWAAENGPVDFYGAGPYAPPDTQPVEYEDMPDLLAGYRRFIHLPDVIEPFGRCVVEAYAAGCELIINNLVGAKYWITEAPDKLETAAEDFWKAVLS